MTAMATREDNVPAMVWNQVQPGVGQLLPEGRFGHTANVVDGAVLVFGGVVGGTRVNSLMRLDPATHTWSVVEATAGSPPSPRSHHAAFSVGEDLYVFGGEVAIPAGQRDFRKASVAVVETSVGAHTTRRTCVDDMHRFNTRAWRSLTAVPWATPRCGFSQFLFAFFRFFVFWVLVVTPQGRAHGSKSLSGSRRCRAKATR